MMDSPDPLAKDQPDSPKRESGFFRQLANLVVAGGWLVVLASIACFFSRQHWAFDLLCQFRIQYLILLTLAVAAGVIARSKFSLLAFIVCFVIHAIPVAPYVLNAPERMTNSDDTTRVMSFNVLTKNDRFPEVISFIKEQDPDFLVLIEIDQRWIDNVGSAIADRYPFTKSQVHGGNFGIGIWSKIPWQKCEISAEGELELPSVETVLEMEGKQLHFVGTHPIPPLGFDAAKSRDAQVVAVASKVRDSGYRMIVGDFNLTPWSPVFTDVLEAGRLVDSALGQTPAPTWQLFPTWLGGLKIDHVLVSPKIGIKNHFIGPRMGSDHCPIVVDFDLE